MPDGYRAHTGDYRQWTYPDDERPSGECYDCGRPYDTFADLDISDEAWAAINPTEHDGAGVLCPNCICDRLAVVGISPVKATVYAPEDITGTGSFTVDPSCIPCREEVTRAGKIALGISLCEDNKLGLDEVIESIRREAGRQETWVVGDA